MQAVTVYHYDFNELSDTAKEYARNDYRVNGLGYEWYDFIFDEWKADLALIGIDVDNIYFSGFCSQGDGACFTGNYSYRKAWRKAVNAEFGGNPDNVLITAGEGLQAIQKPFFYDVSATITHTGRYNHSNSVSFDINEGERNPSDFDTSRFDVLEDDIKSIIRGLMDDLYIALESEYNHLISDETIDEHLTECDLMFLLSGEVA
jgi:hypothetical protein